MTAFFLDTCASNIIIAIVKDFEVMYYFNERNDNTLSSRIMVEIDKAFKSTNLKPQDLDKIFIVNGPGSFTGIRVGVTIAKVWGFTLKVPLIPVSELEVMASAVVADTIIPIIDARRGYVFGAIYDQHLQALLPDCYISLEELKQNKKGILVENADHVDIIKVIRKHQNDEPISHEKLNPNYLKRVEAEEKLA